MRKNRWLYEEVSHAKKRGILVDVDGISYQDKSLEELSLVLQKGTYMMDYEGDALGNIIALHVDHVGSSR